MNSGRIRTLPHGLMDVLRHGNLGALVVPLLLLAAGWGARSRLARKTIKYSWHGVEISHPVGWTIAERTADATDGDGVVLTDLLGPGRIKPRVTLRIAPLPPPPEDSQGSGDSEASRDSDAATEHSTDAQDSRDSTAAATATSSAAANDIAPPAVTRVLSNRLPLYYALGTRAIEIGGTAATRIDSAFAFTAPRAVAGRKRDIPVVMRAIDIVLLRGSEALSVQAAAPIEDFEAQQATLEAIVSSLRVDPVAAVPTAAEPAPIVAPPAADQPPSSFGDVTVAGQVLDADSGLAIPGAIVLFLAPGTSVTDVTDDNLTEIAFTTGLTDSSGHFASNRGLNRPARYSVMIVADGYRWIGSDDGVSIADETPDQVDVGAVRLRRR